MAQKVLLADIDNTLYDWPAFYAPCLRAMIDVLVRELSVPEDQLYEEHRAVFARHDSLEYAFVVQELESVKSLDTDRVKELIRLVRGTFKAVEAKRLQPYPGVVETLEWLHKQDVSVIGVTNSPIWRAQRRLYNLNLDSLLAGLVAWEGFKPSLTDLANEGFVRAGDTRGVTRLRKVWPVSEDQCKPNERAYLIALEGLRSRPSDAWAIGDSLAKDLEPAATLGIRTIWARYGAKFDPHDKDMATILRVTHWSPDRIQTTYKKKELCPDVIVDSFQELTRVIPEKYPTLF